MSALATFLAAWRGAPPRTRSGADARADVRLLVAPAREPATPIERLLVDTLAARGPLSRSALVSLAARVLYRQELARGGWLGDLGIFGEGLFIHDVTCVLDGARDVLWDIETSACRRD